MVAQGHLVGEQQQQIAMIHTQLAQLHTIMISALAPLEAPSLSASPPQIVCPDKYIGDPAMCKGFMFQWSLYWIFMPRRIVRAKYIHLFHQPIDGRSANMGKNQGGEQISSYDHFLQLF